MRSVLFAVALWVATPLYALDFKEPPVIAHAFAKADVKGTFVLYDVNAQTMSVFNKPRAETRFYPASTFKIPNSLIGLSTGAVSTVDEVFPYDGQPQFLKSWERDMGLRDAIKVSNVTVYQALARRIGLPAMQYNVSKLGYGNAEVGQVVDNFWLKGPLKISALEQVQFLARLAQGQLPFSLEHQAKVREISQLEQGDGWTLYGKTGWSTAQTPGIGWWVGWVEQGGKVYSFALNIDMDDLETGPKRIEVGKASLKALGLLR